MRIAPLVLAALVVLAPAAATAQVTFIPPVPPTVTAWIGLETTFTITVTTATPGAITNVSSGVLPSGASFVQQTTGQTSTYLFRWTPLLGSTDQHVCFVGHDTVGATTIGQYCVTIVIGVAQLTSLSGIIRDFQITHPDMNRPAGEGTSTDFVSPTLGVDGKPVFIPANAPSVTNFDQWFNDVLNINTSQVHSITLSNVLSPDPSVFTFSANPWFPAGANNKFFTYEVHGSIQYVPGQQLTFRSSDDLWVFINGQLPAGWNLHGVHGPLSFTVNMDAHAAATDPSLIPGVSRTYRLDVFYANRGATSTPSIQMQMTPGIECTAITAGVPVVDIASNGFNAADLLLLGRARVLNGVLQPLNALNKDESGAAFLNQQIPLRNGFDLRFGFNMPASTAEGFALVLSPQPLRGGEGANLGYAGVPSSLAIEFDARTSPELHDPVDLATPLVNMQHISVHTRVSQANSADEFYTLGFSQPPSTGAPPLFFNNGSASTVRVAYTPNTDASGFGWLRVWMNQILAPLVEVQIGNDALAEIFGGSGSAFIGFTSGSSTTNFGDINVTSLRINTVDVSPELSYVIAPPPPVDWQPGLQQSFLIQLADLCGTNLPVGGDASRVTATFSGPQAMTSTIADVGSGMYRVNYAPSTWGSWQGTIRVDGTEIFGSPVPITINVPDLDGDGVKEDIDNCPAIANADQSNFDGDQLGDACDPDDDNDGILDVNEDDFDYDADAIPNGADPDDDNDGVLDNSDSCRIGDLGWLSTTLTDFDHDGCRDTTEDNDDDNDGVNDGSDAFDRNPNESVDTDGDGVGNNTDPDDDNDGITDAAEIAAGTNPLDPFQSPAFCSVANVGVPLVNIATNAFTSSSVDLYGAAQVANGRVQVATFDHLSSSAGAYLPGLVRVARGFEVDFDFRIDSLGAPEGLALVIARAKGAGGAAGTLGYNMPGVLAVEIDTRITFEYGDPNAGHVSVQSSLSPVVETSATIASNMAIAPGPFVFANGLTHHLRVQYIPSTDPAAKEFKVWIDNAGTPAIDMAIDNARFESMLVGGDAAYVGFTSGTNSTGSLTEVSSVTVRGVPLSPLLSEVVSIPPSVEWHAGLSSSFQVRLRDACGDLVTYGGNAGVLAVTITGAPAMSSTLTDLLDGNYRVDYQSPTYGTWHAFVRMSGLDVRRSPFDIQITPPDSDDDGFRDDTDNCVTSGNAGQTNTDGDAQGDACDADDDNDGVADANDRFPLDATEAGDHDNDGIGDHADQDDDNDGVSDANDPFPLDATESGDNDHDGIGDNADTDDDNDGVADPNDRFPLDATESSDHDDDGIGDHADQDDDNDGVPDANDRFPLDASESADHDNDGIGDNADQDDDNDGVADANDRFPFDASESSDHDNDGTGDNADQDDDNDGVADANDRFPLDATESADADNDGIGDNADPDDDNDGVPDVSDGCPTEPGTSPNGCNVTPLALVGPLAPYRAAASYNSRQTVPIKWQYSRDGVIVESSTANPSIQFFGGVACGTAAGGSALGAPAAAKYDAATMTWQINWKTVSGVGGYYFMITNQETGQVAGPFAICLSK